MNRAFIQQASRRLRSAPLLVLGLAAASGVALEHGLALPYIIWMPALILALGAGLAQRGTWQRGTCMVLATVSAFAMLHGLRMPLRHELQAAAIPQVVRLEGWIAAEPKVSPYRTTVIVEVDRWIEAAGWVPAQGQHVLVSWAGATPRYGDPVRVRGTLARIAPPSNPGPWDRSAWYAQRGVFFQVNSLYARDCVVPADWAWKGNPLLAAGLETRDWMAAKLRLGLEDTPVTTGILQGLVLGVMDSSEPQLFDLFRETGTLHLFAVSGLHVGMVAAVFMTAMRMLGLGRRRAAAFLIPVLVAYAVITGCQVPVVRSTLIAMAFSAAIMLFREPNLLNCTGASAIALLLWDTRQFLQPGFQFSFCVVLTIILVGEATQPLLRHLGAPDPYLPRVLWSRRQELWLGACQWVIGLLVASAAAWIGSLPLTVGNTHLVSWISFLANLVVIPLSFFAVISGLFAVCIGWLPWVGTWLAATCNQFSWLIIQGMMLYLNACWQVPGGYHYGTPELRWTRPEFAATVLSLPRGGGATAITVPGEHWLVDTGGDVPFLVMVEPALRNEGVTRARGLILTHQDSAHISGLAEAEVLLQPRELFTPPRLDPEASNPRRPLTDQATPRILSRGDALPLGKKSRMEVLWPPPELKGGIADDRCLVLRIETPAGIVLMMNDSGVATESALLRLEAARPGTLRAAVLVLHGHGSDVYGSEAFLKAVQPREIILAGESNNPPLFLRRQSLIIPPPHILRTAWLGAIRIESRAEGGFEVFPARR